MYVILFFSYLSGFVARRTLDARISYTRAKWHAKDNESERRTD